MCHTNGFFRRAGACSRRRSIRTVEDACPYSENTFVFSSTYNFLKSLLCFAREVASSDSEKTVGSFCGRTQFAPTELLFLCTLRRRYPVHSVGETCGIPQFARQLKKERRNLSPLLFFVNITILLFIKYNFSWFTQFFSARGKQPSLTLRRAQEKNVFG